MSNLDLNSVTLPSTGVPISYLEYDKVFFAKVRSEATIPSKRDEDGAYDIYACFVEDRIILRPGEIRKIPTGLASAFDSKYRIKIRERSSSGISGLSIRAGLIDSGYRGEWLVVINNTTNKTIIITKEVKDIEEDWELIKYPYTKAIAQAVLEHVPVVEVEEITYDEIKEITSVRGIGGFGSSGK